MAPSIVSVSPGVLSPGAALNDPAARSAISSALIASIKEVYPSYSYDRPPPRLYGATDTVADVKNFFLGHVNSIFVTGAATFGCELRNVWLYDNVLYVMDENELSIVFESWRPIDRPAVKLLESMDAPPSDAELIESECLYLGSPGSGNYGHWLVDDLPRLAALERLAKLPDIIVPAYGEPLNRAKADTLLALFGRRKPNVRFVDPRKPLHLKRTLYITPPTYHPVLKSPDAMNWVRHIVGRKLDRRIWSPRRQKIYVSRGQAHARRLKSEASIIRSLIARGFVILDPTKMTALEQARSFRDADLVVGVMGAAMTNTIFCRSGVRVVHIAPSGWHEPFYWDLAATLGHDFAAIYGPSQPSSLPASHWDFDVDLAAVERAIDG